RGAEVTFISTCQGIPEYRYDDSKVAEEIVRSLPETVQKKVRVVREFHRPELLIEILRGFDLLVATRMHAAILALVAGTPVLPIAYEFKTTELFQHLGLGQWVQEIENVRADALARSVEALLGDLPALRAVIAKRVAQEHDRALASTQLLRSIVAAS